MPVEDQNTVNLLTALAAGNVEAGKQLFVRVYDELHTMAKRTMRKAKPGHVLQTTALIHETYLKLIPGGNLCCNDRKHFFATAGKAMRQILICNIRQQSAAKRGKGERPIPLNENMQVELKPERSLPETMEVLNDVLEKMESNANLQWMCTLVDLRLFVGLTFDQISEMLECSKGKVVRDWNFVRALLMEELGKPR